LPHTSHIPPPHPLITTHLNEVARETGAPVALGAGPCVHAIPSAQNLVTSLGVAAPRQSATALHIWANCCLIKLWNGEGTTRCMSNFWRADRCIHALYIRTYLGNSLTAWSKDVKKEGPGWSGVAAIDRAGTK